MTDNLCNKCRGKVIMHAFCTGACEICGQMFWSAQMPANKVCDNCLEEAKREGKILCRSCGEEIEK